MTTTTAGRIVIVHNRFQLGRSAWKLITAGTVIGILSTICIIYCAPYLYLFMPSFKSAGQLSEPTSPLWPADAPPFNSQGKDLTRYDVPVLNQSGSAETRTLALLL